MKQHISSEDLEQLSEKGRERLREWWKPEYGDLVAFRTGQQRKFRTEFYAPFECEGFSCETVQVDWLLREEEAYPLLSIGQMIELLVSRGKNFSMAYDRNPDMWTFINGKWWPRPGETIDEELVIDICDRLWEATKQVLEREE